MTKLKALLIDDDKQFCQTFETLAEDTFHLFVTHLGKQGLQQLKQTEYDVVFLDLKLGRGMNGLEVLKRIVKLYPDLPVIMVTDFADVDTAVEAMKIGAFHYTSKSPNIVGLKMLIDRQLEQLNWKKIYELGEEQENKCITNSPVMQEIIDKIKTVATTDSTILIGGESGTGKEVCAKEIYRLSKRNNNPFVVVNCGNLNPQLFESEVFGHERGSFTGAVSQKKGKLELANGGTIFLDEIADLPLDSQAKFLRAIEEKKFERVGGTETITVDVRILAASNKNLKSLVNSGEFREDLFYRISVITLTLPPLRERPEDIPLLVNYFLKLFSTEMKKPELQLTDSAIEKMKKYFWPGNIRELKNYIERLVTFQNSQNPITGKEIDLIQENTAQTFPQELLNLPYEEAKKLLLDNFKNVYFQRALQKNHGNVSATAKDLGINRSSFHKMLRDMESRNNQS